MATVDIGVVNYGPEEVQRRAARDSQGHDRVRTRCCWRCEAVSVCGSDLHMWESTHSWPMNYPVVLGHEFGGVIEEVGSRVRGWKPGDRVVSETAAVIDPDSPLLAAGTLQSRSDAPRLWRGGRRRDAPLGAGAGADPAPRARQLVVREGGAHRALLRGLQRGGQQRPHQAGRSRPGARARDRSACLCAAMARLQGAIVGVVGLGARSAAAEDRRALRLRSDRRGRRRLGPRRATAWASMA